MADDPDDHAEHQLFAAAEQGDLAKVKLLLAMGAQPSAISEGSHLTPLMMAAENGHEAVVLALLEGGAPWQAQDKDGFTAGEYAMGHRQVLQLLLEWAVQAELLLGTIKGRERPADEAVNQEYLSSTLRYEDGRLMDAEGEAVMMGWEAPLMERHAEIICHNSGDVLNVGFGLGIVDEAIQRHAPRSHTIIEAHPDVYKHMMEQGWGQKEGVRVVFGRWQDVVQELGPFDGIFWDTYGEFWEEQQDFHAQLPRLLRPNGRYSFFNGLAPDNLFFHLVYGEIARRELNGLGLSVKYDAVPMDAGAAEIWEGVQNRYWHLPTYFIPTCIKEAQAEQQEGVAAGNAPAQEEQPGSSAG